MAAVRLVPAARLAGVADGAGAAVLGAGVVGDADGLGRVVVRLGVLADAIPTALPITPGLDVSGTVTELGDGVVAFRPGDEVIAMFPLDEHGGAAEYAVIAAELVTAAPRVQLSTAIESVTR